MNNRRRTLTRAPSPQRIVSESVGLPTLVCFSHKLSGWLRHYHRIVKRNVLRSRYVCYNTLFYLQEAHLP